MFLWTERALSSELTTVGPLQTALALAIEAGDITKLKDVAAMATALREGARARGMGIDAENEAAEVILRAERAMGAILESMFESGAMKVGGRTEKTAGTLPTYADYGITRTGDALKFRNLSRIPADQFEDMFHDRKGKGERLSRIDFLRLLTHNPAQERAIAEVREALAGDTATPTFAAFEAAATALIEGISQLPEDELRLVAGFIRQLVSAYELRRQAAA